MLMDVLTFSFQYWISTDWYIALLMSFSVNLVTYSVTASLISSITGFLHTRKGMGEYLDQRPLYKNQVRSEIFYGVFACLIFSVASLATRLLYSGIWPESIFSLVLQFVAFTVFYEIYSYFIHRFLHLDVFRKVHFVHHKSVRVTPWGAYSVHPVEAMLIGASAPIFMCVFPMSLAVVLFFHLLGMVFTMLIHSNYTLNQASLFSKIFNAYSTGHALHHKKGSVNYGFVSPALDRILKTKEDN